MDWPALLAIIQSPLVGGALTWAWSLQGRVTVLESNQANIMPLIEAKLIAVVTKIDAIDKRTERIEDRMIAGDK